MELGAFSISLAVKDIEISKQFYQKLGFTVFHGEQSQKWLIMKNGDLTIGLFQDMFEGNILTFNPGWDGNAHEVEGYTDIRVLQKQLKESGIELISEVDENSSGPANLMLIDPDGNQILLDQHV